MALSAIEAEYIAATEAFKGAYRLKESPQRLIWCDSQGAVQLMKNQLHHGRKNTEVIPTVESERIRTT